MVEGGMKCVKYLIFAFNLVFFIAGLCLIIAGAVVETRFKDYLSFFDNSISAAAILLIIVGCVIFVIGFFGCCGAVKENHCMVMTYAVLLGLIFILEISAGIAGFVLRGKVEGMMRTGMEDSMTNYGKPENEGVTKAWNKVQETFDCCGVNSYKDWSKFNSTYVPESCCKVRESATCGKLGGSNLNETINEDGCIEGFKDFIEGNIYTIGGIGLGLAFIQIIGVIFACCLAKSIKKEYETV